jgi:hypothetical protein
MRRVNCSARPERLNEQEDLDMATRKVVFISRLKPGSEQQLTHDLPIEFPAQALSRIEGIKNVTICQGSGMFAAIVEYEGDFEEIFQSYISSPSIQAFQFKIEKFFEDPPRSRRPADLPLAGDIFYWEGEQLHHQTD